MPLARTCAEKTEQCQTLDDMRDTRSAQQHEIETAKIQHQAWVLDTSYMSSPLVPVVLASLGVLCMPDLHRP